MNDLRAVRNTCAIALDQANSALIAYHEMLSDSKERLKTVNRSITNQDDQVERFILSSRASAETIGAQSDRIIRRLKLPLPSPGQYTVSPNSGVQQIIRQVEDLLALSQGLVQELENMAVKLEIERKKWWKVW